MAIGVSVTTTTVSAPGVISSQITRIREQLHDSTGMLWNDAELLRWFNDAYREFLVQTRCVRRLTLIDVPPRYAYTHCYEWESRHTANGPARMMLFLGRNAHVSCTMTWEVAQVEGTTVAVGRTGVTQDWERSYVTDVDQHFVYALPHNRDVILRVAWNHRLQLPTTVRELDELDTGWMRLVGEPHWWTGGTGRINSVELFEIRTDYTQNYEWVNEEHGFARSFSG